jgi:hypothetical protein
VDPLDSLADYAESARLRLGDGLDLIIVQADAPVEKQMTPTITEEALQTT